MEEVRIIELKESVFADNNKQADIVRQKLKKEKTCLINLMSSPGSGKTSVILRIIEMLRDDIRIGVMEADIDSVVDAARIAKTGIPAIQLHTGGLCHLDAGMTQTGLDAMEFNSLGSLDSFANFDCLILENIGNLVCPAEFDTGASFSVMILSVPEGDDKPLKYPLMFSICDAILINKIDTMPYFDFDLKIVEQRIRALNPDIAIFPLSAKTGEGVKEFTNWLKTCVLQWNH